MSVIAAENITKIYGKKHNAFQALDNVSLEIKKGESVAIVGKSGSGKSTLMHVLATLDRPTSGKVMLSGTDTHNLRKLALNKLRNEQVGFIFQQFFLNPRQTVLENVALPLKIKGVGKRERNQKAMKMLEAVELADKAKNKATDLSGGQKQRACIARALINEPEVVFADEPTGNLDTETGDTVLKMLQNLNKKRGITLIIVTHDEDTAAMCQRRIVIKDGKIVEETT